MTGVNPGTWYKFALDASATSATIYVNNQKLTSISQTNIPATALVSVGMFWGNSIYTGNLYIDNVQISTSTTWSQTYGGTDDETGNSVVQTSDGGYAIAGTSSYRLTYFPGISSYVYLVKTDGSGNMQWNKTYGGTGDETGNSVVQTSDGGYAIAGRHDSYVYLVKTDGSGNMQWNKTYGGTGNDYEDSVVQTSDGGYAILGSMLVKTDSLGNMLWNKNYSGNSIVQTSDGGYAIAGGSASPGPQGVNLVKTDSLGNMLWNKTYEEAGTSSIGDILGPHWEPGHSVVQTSDGGYAIAGTASGYRGYYNTAYLVKTDSAGNMQWSKIFGRSANPDYQYGNYGYSVVQSSDGGYVIAGETNAYGAGGFDVFWIKIDVNGN